jgi:hypothetical protein
MAQRSIKAPGFGSGGILPANGVGGNGAALAFQTGDGGGRIG